MKIPDNIKALKRKWQKEVTDRTQQVRFSSPINTHDNYIRAQNAIIRFHNRLKRLGYTTSDTGRLIRYKQSKK